MGNYALFVSVYYPYEGHSDFGWDNFIEAYCSQDAAKSAFKTLYPTPGPDKYGSYAYQIVDLLSKQVVEEG